MRSPRLFETIEENLRTTLGVFALASERGGTREDAGVALAASDVDYPMFNTASLTSRVSSLADLEARLKDVDGWFRVRGLPWSFWLCEDWLDRELRAAAERVCDRFGLDLISELPGMVADALPPPSRLLPGIECRRVEDDATRIAFNHIMSVAFGVPFAVSRAIYESERAWSGPLAGFVGYCGNAPVATAATVIAAGVVGVYAVGTLPAFRRQGYAERIMRFALEEARARCGIERSVLQSSAAGLRLYDRMGYRTVSRYLVFAAT